LFEVKKFHLLEPNTFFEKVKQKTRVGNLQQKSLNMMDLKNISLHYGTLKT
jgi:hypothetical protein